MSGYCGYCGKKPVCEQCGKEINFSTIAKKDIVKMLTVKDPETGFGGTVLKNKYVKKHLRRFFKDLLSFNYTALFTNVDAEELEEDGFFTSGEDVYFKGFKSYEEQERWTKAKIDFEDPIDITVYHYSGISNNGKFDLKISDVWC